MNGSQRIVSMIQDMGGQLKAAQNLRDKFRRAAARDEIPSGDPRDATPDVRNANTLYGDTPDSYQKSSMSRAHHVKNVGPHPQHHSYQSRVVDTTSEGSWPSLKYFADGTKPMENNSEERSTLCAGFDDENGSIVILRGDTEVSSLKPQDCHSVHWDEAEDQKTVKLLLRGQPNGLHGSILLVFLSTQGCVDFMGSLRRTGHIKISAKSR